MAKLIVMAISKELSGDPYVDRHRWRAGDVVTVLADDVVLSRTVLDDPQFRVVDLPKIEPESLATLLASEIGYSDPEAEKLNRVLQRRKSRLDLVAIDVEKSKAEEVPLEKVLLAVEVKPALEDPAIIGNEPIVVKVPK